MLGVRGQLPASIGYDVHLRTYRFEEVEHGNTFVSESEIRQAIAEGRYDPENPPSTASEHLAAIRETALRLDHHHGVEHRIFRLSLDGAASHWAAGTEIDQEKQHDDSGYRHAFVFGDTHDSADVLGVGGITFEGERQRLSGFAELLPSLPDWTVTLAARHDDYDDVGGRSSTRCRAPTG